MSRLSKYVKEKIVKVLVAALVVGSVAGNEGITAQAAEKNINTKAFLGEAYNYGIVARTYVQSNHMQSNFAVINYSLTQKTECGDNITDRENKDIVFGNSMTESGNANEYLYTLDNGSLFELNNGNGCRENTKVYSGGETPNGSSIDDYINGMIQYAAGKSQEAKNLNDTEGVWQDGKYIIDVTGKSGTTFYVNATDILNSLNGDFGKLTINANAGQTVVLNDLSDKIELHRSTINGKQWEESSDDIANRADKVIYNFPNATEVTVSQSVMGTIVAPNAKVTVVCTSALWIVADYVTNTRGEIHRVKDATDEPTPEPEATPTPVPGDESTPTPAPGDESTPTPVPGDESTPTPVPGDESTPTPVPGDESTPTPVPGDESTPTPTPDDPGTPTDPGTPVDSVTPEVLGARRRRVVTITDDPTPLADRAVLGASRRPQTSDDSDAWNLGFALSLTGLGAWLVIRRKEH